MTTTSEDLRALAARIEATSGSDPGLFDRIGAVLAPVLSAAGDSTVLRPADLVSTDYVLHVIAHVTPGWAIRLRGKAFDPDAHWKCSLRPSDATDEDEVIGMSSGPDLSNVLLGSLLRVLAYKADHAL